MRKISQVTTASLKISILALLFFVTAGASLVDNIRSINQHQEYLPGDNSLAFRNSQDTISSIPIPSPAPRNRQGAISIAPLPSPWFINKPHSWNISLINKCGRKEV